MNKKKEKRKKMDVEGKCGQETPDTQELLSCQKELLSWKEKFARVSADLDNFRRRMEKERIQWMQRAQSDLVKDLLPVLDDFNRAVQQQEKQELTQQIREWLSGFTMISLSLEKVLKDAGLQEISEIEIFDPELHEAVVQVDSDEHESGAIVTILQKGYRLNGQVIRPTKVSVAK